MTMKNNNTSMMIYYILMLGVIGSEAIQCYQCSSESDPKGQDLCGAYEPFDKDKHLPIPCDSEESSNPGTFCMKIIKQSPRGFIWDGRWRQVIRQCGSVSNTGVTGVCNWGVYENGVYWQECSCTDDGCNGASNFTTINTIIGLLVTFITIFFSR